MSVFQVQSPDGRTLEVEGAKPPTEQELDQIFTAAFGKKESGRTLTGSIKDTAVSLGQGIVSLPQQVIGLEAQKEAFRNAAPNLLGIPQPPRTLFSEAVKGFTGSIPFKPELNQGLNAVQDAIGAWFSPEQQAVNAEWQKAQAQGFIPAVKGAVENPSVIPVEFLRSFPSMLLAGGLGRLILPGLAPKFGTKLAAPIAAGIGEGVVSSGQNASQVMQETGTELTPGQAALTGSSGILTGILGFAGGRLAKYFKLGDFDVLLAGGKTEAKGNIILRAIKGAITEGALEEMPQSAQEQLAQNLALGKPPMTGVEGAAASGGLVGMVGGGLAQVFSSNEKPQAKPPALPDFDKTAELRSLEAAERVAERKAKEVMQEQLAGLRWQPPTYTPQVEGVQQANVLSYGQTPEEIKKKADKVREAYFKKKETTQVTPQEPPPVPASAGTSPSLFPNTTDLGSSPNQDKFKPNKKIKAAADEVPGANMFMGVPLNPVPAIKQLVKSDTTPTEQERIGTPAQPQPIESLIGQKYTQPGFGGLTALIHKGTTGGENKPYRISFFREYNNSGELTPIDHQDFAAGEDALAYLKNGAYPGNWTPAQPPVPAPAAGPSPISPSTPSGAPVPPSPAVPPSSPASPQPPQNKPETVDPKELLRLQGMSARDMLNEVKQRTGKNEREIINASRGYPSATDLEAVKGQASPFEQNRSALYSFVKEWLIGIEDARTRLPEISKPQPPAPSVGPKGGPEEVKPPTSEGLDNLDTAISEYSQAQRDYNDRKARWSDAGKIPAKEQELLGRLKREVEEKRQAVEKLKGQNQTGNKTTFFIGMPWNLLVDAGKKINEKFKTSKKLSGGAILSFLKNNANPNEIELLKSNGLEDFLKEPRTPQEIEKWIQENGPKLEVKVIPVGEYASPEVRELAELQHYMDSLPRKVQDSIEYYLREYMEDPTSADTNSRLNQAVEDYDQSVGSDPIRRDLERYAYLNKNYGGKLLERGGESATARFEMVNPKPLDQMPGAVDLLVRIPVVPGYQSKAEQMSGDNWKTKEQLGIKYASSHYPNEGKNLLAHVRGYMETLPDGKKVFHIFELQSDWAQGRQQMLAEDKAQTLEDLNDRLRYPSDPLLPHYERLALKAAIEYAKEQGADAIAISDANTAMLTEGHDRAAAEEIQQHGYQYEAGKPKPVIPQEKGMSLHYDQTLPKIAKELTGSEGELVNFGQHQNAMLHGEQGYNPNFATPRGDLILKNPDGSLKTDITARLYPINKTKSQFTFFGKDKPETGNPTVMAMGIGFTPEQFNQAVDAVKKGIRNFNLPFTKGFNYEKVGSLIDFGNHEEAKEASARPSGLGKLPIIGVLFDPRYHDNPAAKSLNNWAREIAAGRGYSKLIAITMREALLPNFQLNENESGRLMNITDKEGNHPFQSDFFEGYMKNPEDYQMPPETKKAVDQMVAIYKDGISLLQKHNLIDSADIGKWPRPVKEADIEGEVIKPERGGFKVGSRQFFDRKLKTEAEGVQRGLVYYSDPFVRMQIWLGKIYKAIADQRLENDQSLMGETTEQRFPKLLEHFKDEIRSGQITVEEVRQRASEPLFLHKEGIVRAEVGGALGAKIYPKEISDYINKYFSSAEHALIRKMQLTSNVMKGLQFTGDISPAFIQGQVLLTNPRTFPIWARATKNMISAIFDEQTLGKMINENPDLKVAAEELTASGVRLGQAFDFYSGLNEDEILPNLKGVGPFFRRMGVSASTFVDAALIMQWAAWRNVVPENQKLAAIENLQNMLGRARMEEIGLSANRTSSERVLLTASSMMRGAASYMVNAFEKGVPGKISRQGLAWLMATPAIVIYAFMKSKGYEEKEIEARFNPGNSEFMTVPVEINGSKYNIGMGGPYRSLFRLMGMLTSAGTDDKKAFSEFIRWTRGKMAPFPSMVWDITSEKDFLGRRTNWRKALADRALPVSAKTIPELISTVVNKEGDPSEAITTAAGGDIVPGLMGLQSTPSSGTSVGARKILRSKAELFNDVDEIVKQVRTIKDPIVRNQKVDRLLKDFPETNRPRMKRLIRSRLWSSMRSRTRAEAQAELAEEGEGTEGNE